jgi:hypothetical protein
MIKNKLYDRFPDDRFPDLRESKLDEYYNRINFDNHYQVIEEKINGQIVYKIQNIISNDFIYTPTSDINKLNFFKEKIKVDLAIQLVNLERYPNEFIYKAPIEIVEEEEV